MTKNEPKKNPDWTEEELIIALDIYYELHRSGDKPSDSHAKIIQASRALNSLKIHPQNKKNIKFRDPPGVKRRIGYFQKLERGENINGREAYLRVWEKYRDKVPQLHHDAIEIINRLSLTSDEPLEDDYNAIRRDIIELKRNNKIDITEKNELIKARRGQGRFRRDLLSLWKACPITGCTEPQLLKASHIKPWSKSSNNERLDPYNGILLTPTFDALFDRGYISFEDSGKALISNTLDEAERAALGIKENITIKIFENHKTYLYYHRTQIFKS